MRVKRVGAIPAVRDRVVQAAVMLVLEPIFEADFEDYLHWFDHVFHRADGPAQWASAKLIRYADDS